MSPNAQNEILKIMALKVLNGIASNIAESGYYSIMADESTNVSNIKHLVIYINWVDNEMRVCVEYIGMMPVAQTNADTICIRIQDARGQCYDGCSTMAGTRNGLLHKSRTE